MSELIDCGFGWSQLCAMRIEQRQAEEAAQPAGTMATVGQPARGGIVDCSFNLGALKVHDRRLQQEAAANVHGDDAANG
jgi:hypothetical protein